MEKITQKHVGRRVRVQSRNLWGRRVPKVRTPHETPDEFTGILTISSDDVAEYRLVLDECEYRQLTSFIFLSSRNWRVVEVLD